MNEELNKIKVHKTISLMITNTLTAVHNNENRRPILSMPSHHRMLSFANKIGQNQLNRVHISIAFFDYINLTTRSRRNIISTGSARSRQLISLNFEYIKILGNTTAIIFFRQLRNPTYHLFSNNVVFLFRSLL